MLQEGVLLPSLKKTGRKMCPLYTKVNNVLMTYSNRVLGPSALMPILYAHLMVRDLDCHLKSAICLWKFANEGCSLYTVVMVSADVVKSGTRSIGVFSMFSIRSKPWAIWAERLTPPVMPSPYSSSHPDRLRVAVAEAGSQAYVMNSRRRAVTIALIGTDQTHPSHNAAWLPPPLSPRALVPLWEWQL